MGKLKIIQRLEFITDWVGYLFNGGDSTSTGIVNLCANGRQYHPAYYDPRNGQETPSEQAKLSQFRKSSTKISGLVRFHAPVIVCE